MSQAMEVEYKSPYPDDVEVENFDDPPYEVDEECLGNSGSTATEKGAYSRWLGLRKSLNLGVL